MTGPDVHGRASTRWALWAALAWSLVAGCGGDKPAKAAAKPADAGSDAGGDVDAGGAGDATADAAGSDVAVDDTALDDDAAASDGQAPDAADAVAPDATADDGPEGNSDSTETDAASPPPQWQVLVYMSADNNLEKSSVADMKEMLALKDAANVTFYIQSDRAEGFYELGLEQLSPWKGTKRLKVHAGVLTEVADLGEVNMGTQQALAEFVAWGLQQGKPAHRALVLWDHGHGWRGFGGDDFDKDELTIAELAGGIADGLKTAGVVKFDLLGLDACLMGGLFVLGQLHSFADWLIASEDFEPENGWDYHTFKILHDAPATTPKALAAAIVKAYAAHCEAHGKTTSVALAALEAAKVPALLAAFADLSKALQTLVVDAAGAPDPKAAALLPLTKLLAPSSDDGVQRFGRKQNPKDAYHYLDLRDLAQRLAASDVAKASPAVAKATDAVIAAVGAAVLQRVVGDLTPNSHGVYVYLPYQGDYYLSAFDTFGGANAWVEFLAAYYKAGKGAAADAPGFDKGKGCSGCAGAPGEPTPTCDGGALAAAQVVAAGSAQKVAYAEMWAGYEDPSGALRVVARTPAVIDAKTGAASSAWNQRVLVIRQGAAAAILAADSKVVGTKVIHEASVQIAGPASCACVLPGDPGFWDTDGDGTSNCVEIDDDADGHPDGADNCPYVANADQKDADGNQVGDACAAKANAPAPACVADAQQPFGPERTATLQVTTHLVQGTTLGYSFFVTSTGGVSEEAPKGWARLRPMVEQLAPGKTAFEWVAGAPLPMRLDQPLTFEYALLEGTYAHQASGAPKPDAKGKAVSLQTALGLGDIFLRLRVVGAGGFGDAALWQGDPDEGIGPCPPADLKAGLCAAGQAVDCDGNCWPAAQWGDATCHAGQGGGANFYCLALAYDKGACTPPPCPGADGLVPDCQGACIAKPALVGDKACHDGSDPAIPDLVCAAHSYDGGDCPCAKGCFGHGTCNAGACACEGGWTGTYCDVPPSCGDGACSGSEQCATCAKDCGSCTAACGDKACAPALGENCSSCPGDCGACGCGDGACSAGEDCASCAGDCGPCPVCGDETCAVWTPTAPFAKAKGERCDTCPADCGACQGDCCSGLNPAADNFVGAGCGNATVTQCVCALDASCCDSQWTAACAQLASGTCGLSCCKADCTGKACGPDGCGGSCGVCDDGNPCTDDLCDAGTGSCSATPGSGACNDGDPCTIASSCSGGACGGGAPTCAGGPCDVVACNAGVCAAAKPKVCDDGNPCTDDACDKASGCVAVANTAACDDGNACTEGDACAAKACKAGAPKTCLDDGNSCTTEVCDVALGCNTPAPGPCYDGDNCTIADACDKGACVAGASACGLTVLDGLVAHFDARNAGSITKDGGGVVSKWADLSGKGNHLTPAGDGPVYKADGISGLPALDFSGGKGLISAPFGLKAGATLFVVLKWGTSQSTGTVVTHGQKDNDIALETVGDKLTTLHFQSANDNVGAEVPVQVGGSYVITAQLAAGKRYVSATATTTVSATGDTSTAGVYDVPLYVGKSVANEASNCTIGQILYYDRALSVAERDLVLTWLRSEWKLALPTPDFLWLDANDLASLTKDGAGKVSVWKDLGGKGRDAAVGANLAPTWQATAAQSGKPAILFDGGGMRLVTQAVATVPQMTVIAAYKMKGLGDWSAIVHHGDQGTFRLRKTHLTDKSAHLSLTVGTNEAAPILPLNLGHWQLVTAMQDATTTTIYYSQSAPQTLTQATIPAGTAPLYVGNANFHPQHLDGWLAELRIFSTALHASDRAAVETQLRVKWGL